MYLSLVPVAAALTTAEIIGVYVGGSLALISIVILLGASFGYLKVMVIIHKQCSKKSKQLLP